jgi:ribosome-associated translation inhibitor RaiA
VRRHLERRLVDAEDRFERLLARAVPDGLEQEGWRARFYHGEPPAPQGAARSAPVYRGRAESGVAVEVIDTRDGECDVVIGGEVVKRLDSGGLAASIEPDGSFDLDGIVFAESFEASERALAALRRAIEGEPPSTLQRQAGELLGDGLVDDGLEPTLRGLRAFGLGARAGGAEPAIPPIALELSGEVNERMRAYLLRKVRAVARLAPQPILAVRAGLRLERNPSLERPAVAKASLDVNGRHVRAQVAGAGPQEAIDLLEERLRRRLEELGDRDRAARRARPDLPAPRPDVFPRPPEERRLISHKTYAPEPMTEEQAAWELRLGDYDFYLYTDEASGAEHLVHRLANGELEVRRSAPGMRLPDALSRLDASLEPFVFFRDVDNGRGAVAYRRYDGHYGLITPWEP